MTKFKIGNLVRLNVKVLDGWHEPHDEGVGLIVAIVPPIDGLLVTYYRILFGEEKYIFRANEIELL